MDCFYLLSLWIMMLYECILNRKYLDYLKVYSVKPGNPTFPFLTRVSASYPVLPANSSLLRSYPFGLYPCNIILSNSIFYPYNVIVTILYKNGIIIFMWVELYLFFRHCFSLNISQRFCHITPCRFNSLFMGQEYFTVWIPLFIWPLNY